MASPVSPQARLIFQDAFDKFEQTVTIDDARSFHSTTLQDVRLAARKIEEQLAARQCLRNMRRLQPFLAGLGRYEKAVDTLCNGTPYLPWIWAPVKLMVQVAILLSVAHEISSPLGGASFAISLAIVPEISLAMQRLPVSQIASDNITAFEKLISAYSRIAETLPRFDRLSEAFKDKPDFQQVLAVFYADILNFHQAAYKFFRRRGWSCFFKSTWARFDLRFESILDSLARHSELVDKEASSFDIVEAKEWRARRAEEIAKREKVQRETQFQSVLSWLEIKGTEQEDEHDRLSQRCHPGSCDWILKNMKIKSWMRRGPEQPFLWLKGKPGSGKSVLCSKVVNYLRQDQQSVVLVYFCNYLSSTSNNCAQIFRSLAAQILRTNKDLACYIFDEYVSQGVAPSVMQLKKIIPYLLSTITSVHIVIDGLDEFDQADQRQVLTEVLPFASSNTSTGICKVLVSSREVPQISRALSKRSKLPLAEEREAIRGAIQNFVHDKLVELHKNLQDLAVDQQLIFAIEKELVRKADGMFLWVQLVLSTLENVYSIEQMQKAVETLPEGLFKIYDRIISNLMGQSSSENRALAVRILQWVACAARPLKKYEVQNGIALHVGNTELNDRTKLSEHVLDLCKPLIEDSYGGTVTFVHFSVKEYLIDKPSEPFLKPLSAHHEIAFACIISLTSSLALVNPDIPEEERVIAVGKGFHGLHPYADENWFEHLFKYLQSKPGDHLLSALDPLFNQLAMLCDMHRAIELKLQKVSSFTSSGVENGSSDQRIEYLRNHEGIQFFIGRLCAFRRACKASQAQTGAESEALDLKKDPTLFSLIRNRYNHIVRQLLDSESTAALTDEELIKFKDAYGTSAYLCRFKACSRSSDGFASELERNNHEQTHKPKLYCSNIKCTYSTLGFTTVRALKRHISDFHISSDQPRIPDRIPGHVPSLKSLWNRSRSPTTSPPSTPTEENSTIHWGIENLEKYYNLKKIQQPSNNEDACIDQTERMTRTFQDGKSSAMFLASAPDPSDLESCFARHLETFHRGGPNYDQWVSDTREWVDNGMDKYPNFLAFGSSTSNSQAAMTFERIASAIPPQGIELDKLVVKYKSHLESRSGRLAFLSLCQRLLYRRITSRVYDPSKCDQLESSRKQEDYVSGSEIESKGIFEYIQSDTINRTQKFDPPTSESVPCLTPMNPAGQSNVKRKASARNPVSDPDLALTERSTMGTLDSEADMTLFFSSPILEGSGPEEDFGKLKCICGYSDDDGNTVLCDTCDTWQHIACYYKSVNHVPDIHECVDCDSRPVDRKGAAMHQKQARSKLIDPNEPRYCYCDENAYGTMIACDSKGCSREWFHLECIGLTRPPHKEQKWYCRNCK